MRHDTVVTGEAVELALPVARLGSRSVALAIDIAAQVLLLQVAAIGVGGLVTQADAALSGAVVVLVLVGVFLVWPVTFETLSRGRSLGKLAMGLRVVRDDGGPIRFRQALVRNLVGFAFEWPGVFFAPLTWIFGLVTMLFSPRGKRLGDLAAGTIVLHERLPDRGGHAPVMPPPLASWAQTLDLTRLDDGLALAARQFLSRSGELDAAPREDLGRRLAAEVAAVTAPAPPPGTPGWAYLAAVLAERRRREAARLAERRAALVAAGYGTTGLGPSGTTGLAPSGTTTWAPTWAPAGAAAGTPDATADAPPAPSAAAPVTAAEGFAAPL
ncbi:MAG TPA: RDD family protein [Mycobacteriales bacterium]